MKKKSPAIILMNLWFAVFMLVAAAACIHMIAIQRSQHTHMAAASALVAICTMTYYSLKGHKKADANFLKTALLCCAGAQFFAIIPMILKERVLNERDVIAILSCAAFFGIYLVLALVPDLGKKKSLTLSAIMAVDCAATVIVLIALHPGAVRGVAGANAQTMENMRMVVLSMLANAAFVCEWFKYQDKAARGTK